MHFFSLLLFCAQLSGPSAPQLSWEDPPGDDHGPGGYIYPSDPNLYPPGSFDLRRFSVIERGPELEFRVRLGAPPRRPAWAGRDLAAQAKLDSGLFVQNIDIYIDNAPGGWQDALPGRQHRLGPGGWEVALVLTPQPRALRRLLEDWPARRGLRLPLRVQLRGRTVIARVAKRSLGEGDIRRWGFAVAVSGARWQQSFQGLDRLRGAARLDALTLQVATVAEPRAFGGGQLGADHPQVIDVLSPPGASQEAALRDFGPGRLAQLPFVYDQPPAPGTAQAPQAAPPGAPKPLPKAGQPGQPGEPGGAPAAPGLQLSLQAAPTSHPAPAALPMVSDLRGELVVVTPAPAGVKDFQLGQVLAADGRPLGWVVVTKVYPKFLLTTAIEGGERMKEGARVDFRAKRP